LKKTVKSYKISVPLSKQVTRITKTRQHEIEGEIIMGHEFEALSGQIIEAAIDVHMRLGPGYLESIYVFS
jgi:hypothetical protein